MDYYSMAQDFHLHILSSTSSQQTYQIALARYEETCLILDQTLAAETDPDARCKLHSLRRPLKSAANELKAARAALVQIAAIQAASGVQCFATRMSTDTRRTPAMDSFLTRLQVYDGVSKMYQQYMGRKLQHMRRITSDMLRKITHIVHQQLCQNESIQ